jgi:hypothetical protein
VDAMVLEPAISTNEGVQVGDTLDAIVEVAIQVSAKEGITASDAFEAEVEKPLKPPVYDDRYTLGVTYAIPKGGGGGVSPIKTKKKKKVKVDFIFLGDIYEYDSVCDPGINVVLEGMHIVEHDVHRSITLQEFGRYE